MTLRIAAAALYLAFFAGIMATADPENRATAVVFLVVPFVLGLIAGGA